MKVKSATVSEITYEILPKEKKLSVKEYLTDVTNGYQIDKSMTQDTLMKKLQQLENTHYE